MLGRTGVSRSPFPALGTYPPVEALGTQGTAHIFGDFGEDVLVTCGRLFP
jgi:hypothetical protein